MCIYPPKYTKETNIYVSPASLRLLYNTMCQSATVVTHILAERAYTKNLTVQILMH